MVIRGTERECDDGSACKEIDRVISLFLLHRFCFFIVLEICALLMQFIIVDYRTIVNISNSNNNMLLFLSMAV